jgi:hypothetical protein
MILEIHNLPITAVNKTHVVDDIYEVSIIVINKDLEITAGTTFKVRGINNVPYREDVVQVKKNIQTGESSIVWDSIWF